MVENQKPLKLLITGSSSRIGYRLREQAIAKNFITKGISLDLSDENNHIADITKKPELDKIFKKEKPDCIIHAAAFTDVDGCEQKKELSWDVNVLGSQYIAELCESYNIRLIYISTDYIFDGKKGPYSETDEPNPINFYGLTKLEAEKKVHSNCKNALTIRTCVPYDWNPRTLPTFLMWLIQKLQAGTKIKIVADQKNTPTFVPHLAKTILEFCDNNIKGIVHISGREFISRYDFALKVCKIFKYDLHLVEPCLSDEFKQLAARPLEAGLKVTKVERLLKQKMLDVDSGLKQSKKLFETS